MWQRRAPLESYGTRCHTNSPSFPNSCLGTTVFETLFRFSSIPDEQRRARNGVRRRGFPNRSLGTRKIAWRRRARLESYATGPTLHTNLDFIIRDRPRLQRENLPEALQVLLQNLTQ